MNVGVLVNVGVGSVGVMEGVRVEFAFSEPVEEAVGAELVGVVGIKIVYEHAKINRLTTGRK